MKVIFDHQIYLFQQYGGISRYFYELTSILTHELNVDVVNTICLSNNIYATPPLYSSAKFLPDYSFKGKARFMDTVNQISSLLKLNKKYDIFHPTYYDTYFLERIGKRPFVITFHDLTHEKLATRFEDLSRDKQLFQRRKLLLDRASKVISVSASTKNDIMDIYKVPSDKIEVVHLASSIWPGNQDMEIPYDNYILYVGNRQSYKNFILFIESISPLLQKDNALKVLCAGGGVFTLDEINLFNDFKIADQLIQISINDNLLSSLYKKALFFVFPSLYEGFGIPILEAFTCSCPVLLSDISPFREVASDAAIYFNPTEREDLLDKATQLLQDEYLRARLKTAGSNRGEEFTWFNTAKSHQEIYQSIL